MLVLHVTNDVMGPSGDGMRASQTKTSGPLLVSVTSPVWVGSLTMSSAGVVLT